MRKECVTDPEGYSTEPFRPEQRGLSFAAVICIPWLVIYGISLHNVPTARAPTQTGCDDYDLVWAAQRGAIRNLQELHGQENGYLVPR